MIGTVLLSLGLLLLFLGGAGMLRFRSPYDRLQAAGVADIGGTALLLVGLILEVGFGAQGGLILVLLFFLLCTGPVATHSIARGAFVRGERSEGPKK